MLIPSEANCSSPVRGNNVPSLVLKRKQNVIINSYTYCPITSLPLMEIKSRAHLLEVPPVLQQRHGLWRTCSARIRRECHGPRKAFAVV